MLEFWDMGIIHFEILGKLDIPCLTHHSIILFFFASLFFAGTRIPSKERLMFKGFFSPGFKEKRQ